MFHLFAQVTDGAQVIQKATDSGWAAGLLALIVVAGFATLGFLVRGMQQRQEKTDEYIRNNLTTLQVQSNTAMINMTGALDKLTTLLNQNESGSSELCTEVRHLIKEVSALIPKVEELIRLMRESQCPLTRSAGAEHHKEPSRL